MHNGILEAQFLGAKDVADAAIKLQRTEHAGDLRLQTHNLLAIAAEEVERGNLKSLAEAFKMTLAGTSATVDGTNVTIIASPQAIAIVSAIIMGITKDASFVTHLEAAMSGDFKEVSKFLYQPPMLGLISDVYEAPGVAQELKAKHNIYSMAMEYSTATPARQKELEGNFDALRRHMGKTGKPKLDVNSKFAHFLENDRNLYALSAHWAPAGDAVTLGGTIDPFEVSLGFLAVAVKAANKLDELTQPRELNTIGQIINALLDAFTKYFMKTQDISTELNNALKDLDKSVVGQDKNDSWLQKVLSQRQQTGVQQH